MVGIKAVFSTRMFVNEIVSDIKEQLQNFDVKLLIFFASSNFDQISLSNLMQYNFKEASILGCSTAGEIVSGKMLKNSVVAMAFDSNTIADVKIEVIDKISSDINVEPAFLNFEQYYGESSYSMDITKYVGIILVDGLSMKEEKIMDAIGARTNVNFIGGSAGDDLNFDKTHVYAHGKAYSNAAVLALLKPATEFGIIKTQSFKILDKIFTATKVDEELREVKEFNNKPAAQVYAQSLDVPIDEIKNYFMTNPLGLVVGKENIYVRCPQQVIDGQYIRFFCNILKEMEVNLLEATDIIDDTKKVIADKKKEFGDISGMINFHCIFRTLGLEKNGLTQEYADIFKDIPTIGFSTYGEEYIGHMNQTSTILVFKGKNK